MSSTTSASNPNAVAAVVPSELSSPVVHIADPYENVGRKQFLQILNNLGLI
jgi:hypothetical protein